VNLLFQIDNNDFRIDFILKPYPKYEYQAVSRELKTAEKQAFLKACNESISDHLYDLHLLRKKGYYFFCIKKKQFRAFKRAGIN
jgi:hypothetical protein